ncbi:MAG: helix-turn-helix transcriptional regulator [Beijerinckiaceae bacterium]|nr:helix-turn-helix transcriptional regulator [Beijerinckiaceae bacterium]
MQVKGVECPLEATLNLLDGRWRVLILRELFREGTLRFGALHRALPGISQRVLTQELRGLEAAGIVSRKVYAEVPPKVEYALTKTGKTLDPVLAAMSEWGTKHLARAAVN